MLFIEEHECLLIFIEDICIRIFCKTTRAIKLNEGKIPFPKIKFIHNKKLNNFVKLSKEGNLMNNTRQIRTTFGNKRNVEGIPRIPKTFVFDQNLPKEEYLKYINPDNIIPESVEIATQVFSNYRTVRNYV